MILKESEEHANLRLDKVQRCIHVLMLLDSELRPLQTRESFHMPTQQGGGHLTAFFTLFITGRKDKEQDLLVTINIQMMMTN